MYKLKKELVVSEKADKVWEFLASPANLNEMTPKDLSFNILTELPEKMYSGLIIEYKIKIPLAGVWKWVTEIKHIREGKSFVDEQRQGPYKFWYHYHEIGETDGGTKITDIVYYSIPFSIIGKIMHSLYIKSKLIEIFNFRSKKFSELLNTSSNNENSQK